MIEASQVGGKNESETMPSPLTAGRGITGISGAGAKLDFLESDSFEAHVRKYQVINDNPLQTILF